MLSNCKQNTITPIKQTGGGGEGGVTDHAELTGRSKTNQHPISAINGLQSSLDSLNSKANAIGARTNVLEDTIIHKAVNVQLYYDGDNILDDKDGNILTYNDVYNIISEENNNVSVNYMDTNVLYPAFWTGDAVEFSNLLMIDDKTYSTRLIINAENLIKYDEEDLTSGGGQYTLPVATTTQLGGVKPDGTTIVITNDGVLSSTGGDTSNLANVDLSNISAVGKNALSGSSLPSSSYINIALSGGETNYTPPANGYLIFTNTSSAGGQRVLITNVATDFSFSSYSTTSGQNIKAFLPVLKGVEHRFVYSAPTVVFCRFYYAEGEI